MKNTLFTLVVAGAVAALVSCDKRSGFENRHAEPATRAAQAGGSASYFARFTGQDYSMPVPKDTANLMIGSYLTSVGYPAVDTALRALSFDADTLRAYLANSSITTIKFMFAHKLSYVNTVGYGVKSGLTPGSMTMVIVGLDDADAYVLNSSNSVYDHCLPCPAQCPGPSGTFIQ